MHKDKNYIKTETEIGTGIEKNFEEIIAEGANKVIKNLLETIDDIKDNEEELIKDETIEEVCIDLTTPKKYFNECDKCGYISFASRRYETCKQILMHKEKCTESKAIISGLRERSCII